MADIDDLDIENENIGHISSGLLGRVLEKGQVDDTDHHSNNDLNKGQSRRSLRKAERPSNKMEQLLGDSRSELLNGGGNLFVSKFEDEGEIMAEEEEFSSSSSVPSSSWKKNQIFSTSAIRRHKMVTALIRRRQCRTLNWKDRRNFKRRPDNSKSQLFTNNIAQLVNKWTKRRRTKSSINTKRRTSKRLQKLLNYSKDQAERRRRQSLPFRMADFLWTSSSTLLRRRRRRSSSSSRSLSSETVVPSSISTARDFSSSSSSSSTSSRRRSCACGCASARPRPPPSATSSLAIFTLILTTLAVNLPLGPRPVEARISLDGGNPDAKRLYDDLLSNYNKLVRPVVNTTDPLTVRIKLKLSQLIDVNLKNQIMTTNLWVEQFWYDYKLVWDPEEYGGVKQLHVPSDHIWRPDIVLYNNADGNFEVTLATKATLWWNGLVEWKPPAIYKSSCEIDVEYFPFDEQTCVMKFGSWTYDGFQVDLRHMCEVEGTNIVPLGIDLSEFYMSVEWDILEVPAVRNEKFYTCCDEPYLDITFNITMRRKTLFYTVNLIIPCMGISFLTVLTFYLPSDSGEKVTLSISILTSLYVFFLLVVEIIPPTSLVVPLLGKYLIFAMILVSISICVTVVVLNVHFRSPQTHKMAPWVKRVFIHILPRLLIMKRPQFQPDKHTSLRKVMLRTCMGQDASTATTKDYPTTTTTTSGTYDHNHMGSSSMASSKMMNHKSRGLMGNHHRYDNGDVFAGRAKFDEFREAFVDIMPEEIPGFPRARIPGYDSPRWLSFDGDNYYDGAGCKVHGDYLDNERSALNPRPTSFGPEPFPASQNPEDPNCESPEPPMSASALPPYDHSNCSAQLHKSCQCVSFIAEHTKQREEATKVKEDWKYVAMVLDRLFLWIFTLAVCVGTAGIILQAPSLYDDRKPIDREISDIGIGTHIREKSRTSTKSRSMNSCAMV